MATITRARWLTEDVMGYSWEEHFEGAFERKMAQFKRESDALKTATYKDPKKPKKKGWLGRAFGRGLKG